MSQQSDNLPAIPKTQGVKYAGSKRQLLPHILSLVKQVGGVTVLDGFAGTTRVSQALARQGYRVICNDISVWSEVFGTCYLLNREQPNHYRELVEYLDQLPPEDGWFTAHYGGQANGGDAVQSDGLKKPWQVQNTRKLDAIRAAIDRLQLSEVERAVAITSLILALDKVDNTLGHYSSYLKKWSPRSFNELRLEIPDIHVTRDDHEVHRGDIFDVIDTCEVDIAYLDPPYGSNNEKMPPSRVRYAAYYHLWSTICLNDRPELFGKSLRRSDTSDGAAATVFEEFRRNQETGKFLAVEAIERLINSVSAKHIILSYSTGGRATAESLHEVLRAAGKLIEVIEVDHKRNVMAQMTWTNDWVRDQQDKNRELLFVLEKR
jgi:adenine-specific DNA-methyltransferase